jgi:hypothetical protein
MYRQVAAELGRLPPELIQSVVLFYGLALDYGRFADGAPTAEQALETIQGVAPRLKMYGAVVVKTLEKFEASSFRAEADIRPTQAEVKELAAKTGYPLDQILKERGLQL